MSQQGHAIQGDNHAVILTHTFVKRLKQWLTIGFPLDLTDDASIRLFIFRLHLIFAKVDKSPSVRITCIDLVKIMQHINNNINKLLKDNVTSKTNT